MAFNNKHKNTDLRKVYDKRQLKNLELVINRVTIKLLNVKNTTAQPLYLKNFEGRN